MLKLVVDWCFSVNDIIQSVLNFSNNELLMVITAGGFVMIQGGRDCPQENDHGETSID